MELWNEFTILLIYGQILAQTDFVEDPEKRLDSGWYLIYLITVNVMTNFGYVFITEAIEVFYCFKVPKELKNSLQKGKLVGKGKLYEAESLREKSERQEGVDNDPTVINIPIGSKNKTR